MSRIQFEVVIHDKVIPVVVGWDRILGQCHVGVNDINLDEEDWDDERFDAVLEAGAKGLSSGLSVAGCRSILSDAGIEAPPGTFDLLEEHVIRNAGNVVVRVDRDGTKTVLFDGETVPA